MTDKTKPDAILVALPGTLDGEIRYLIETGLRIEGALRLFRAAEYWHPDEAPDFLADRTGGREMYERLEALSHSIYRRLGHARFLLSRTDSLLRKEYDVPGPEADDGFSFMQRFFEASKEDGVATEAMVGSFLIALVSATDVLAAIGTLVLNLDYSIWRAHFWKFEKALREAKDSPDENPQLRRIREVASAVLPELDRQGDQTDWLPQLLQFRNAQAHRPISIEYGRPTRGKGGFRTEKRMLRDPCQLPGKVIPNPLRTQSWTEDSATEAISAFLDEPTEEYCDWALEQVVRLCDRALDALAIVYEERCEKPDLFNNNPEVLLRKSVDQKPTRFRGTSTTGRTAARSPEKAKKKDKKS